MTLEVVDVAPGYRTRLAKAGRFSAGVLLVELAAIGIWNAAEIIRNRTTLTKENR